MRRDHGRTIDHRITRCLRSISLRRNNPQRIETKGRIFCRNAIDIAKHLPWVDCQLSIRNHLTLTHVHAVNTDAVFVGAKIEVVPDVYRVNQESKFLRKLLSDTFDSAQKISTLARIDQGNQTIANLKTNLVKARHIVPTELIRFGLGICFGCRIDHFRH